MFCSAVMHGTVLSTLHIWVLWTNEQDMLILCAIIMYHVGKATYVAHYQFGHA